MATAGFGELPVHNGDDRGCGLIELLRLDAGDPRAFMVVSSSADGVARQLRQLVANTAKGEARARPT